MQRVAVVGTGTIGLGWSIVFARGGLDTGVYDVSEEQLSLLMKRVPLELELLAEHADGDEFDASAIIRRLHPSTNLEEVLSGVEYVQENVPEDVQLKKDVFAQLDELCPAETILASSTSAIPMSEIAENVKDRQRCIVVHPTNPPHIVPLVEIVPGRHTAADITDKVRAFMEWLNQAPIICHKEISGFVLNRLQVALVREAIYLMTSGVASPEDIDRCVHDGLGLRWAFLGPLGVEETNAASIEDDLHKFREVLNELMEDVCRPTQGVTDEVIVMAKAAISRMYPATSHDDLVRYRNQMVLSLRDIKSKSSHRSGRIAKY